MHKFILTLIVAVTLNAGTTAATEESALAVLVPGTGTYSRPISTDSKQAQAFFDQGLRLAWSFIFRNPSPLTRRLPASIQKAPCRILASLMPQGQTPIAVIGKCRMTQKVLGLRLS